MPGYIYECPDCKKELKAYETPWVSPTIHCKNCGGLFVRKGDKKLIKNGTETTSYAQKSLDTKKVALREATKRQVSPAIKNDERDLPQNSVPKIGISDKSVTPPQEMTFLKQETTYLPQESPQLAENIDADKLLAEIVQGLLMAHARLDRMENALRQELQSVSSREQLAAKEHQNYLLGRLQTLHEAQVGEAKSESLRQSENWKNLNSFLKNWQARIDQNFAAAAKDMQVGTAQIAEKLASTQSALQELTRQRTETNRRLLIWLVCFSAASLLCLGAIAYKLFIH